MLCSSYVGQLCALLAGQVVRQELQSLRFLSHTPRTVYGKMADVLGRQFATFFAITVFIVG